MDAYIHRWCMHMPRVTLYVPDDLKTRMDVAGEAVNWSAVAQRAFREAVATQFIRKDSTDMTSVVDRLRASKERIEVAAVASGRECGRTWAQETAEYDELNRIAEWRAVSIADGDRLTLQELVDP